MQILGYTQLLNNEGMDIHSNVLPNTRPWPDGKCYPWRQNNCFLNCRNHVKIDKLREFHKTNLMEKERKGDDVTWVDLRTSANAPSASFFLFSSEIASNSAIS